MNIKIEKNYISVVSPKITWLCGLSSGSPKLARAAALYPFIFFRSEEDKIPWIINHETIHFRQQIEMLFLGNFILSFLETAYSVLFLRKTLKESYLWRSSEQEAYLNQQDPTYLDNRKFWAQFKYIKNKKDFILGKLGEITLLN